MTDANTSVDFEISKREPLNSPHAVEHGTKQEQSSTEVVQTMTQQDEDVKEEQIGPNIDENNDRANESTQQGVGDIGGHDVGDKENPKPAAAVPVMNSPYHSRVQDTLMSHDFRLQTLEKRFSKRPGVFKKAGPGGKKDVEGFMFQTKPEVRDCNWEQFKNRFSFTEPPAAIEVLLAGEDLEAEMEDEQLRRVSQERKEELTQVSRKQETKTQIDKVDTQRIERVRINSLIILAFLGKVTGETYWSSQPHKPHTFLKPFKIFIHFQKEMEKELMWLKAKFAQKSCPVQDSGELLPQPTQTSVTEEVKPDDVLLHTEQGTTRAYEEVKCYMEFVETRLLPRYHMFDTADANKTTKVRYDDLWCLFRPGETLYEPCDVKANAKNSGIPENLNPHSRVFVPSLWRGWYMSTDNVRWEVDDLEVNRDGVLLRHRDPQIRGTTIMVCYIDFDGNSYSGVNHTFTIDHYSGEKDVTALPIYPIRFAQGHTRTLQRLKERGQKFQSVVSQPHDPQSYEGWTLIRNPLGGNLQDESGQALKFPEHIDGDVIVDFHETYQTRPWWKPDFFKYGIFINWQTTTWLDNFYISYWSDTDRSERIRKIHEIVVHEDNVDQLESNLVSAKDKFCPIINKETDRNSSNLLELSDDDLCLLPSRIFVYGLRERNFASVDIRYLKPSSTMENPFEHLKIPEKHKRMIQSSVFEHFEKKIVQREAAKKDRELPDQDFIGHKGRGLIFLLHGAPGVGKTATAEAVGYAYKKPLFPITCGDLGIDPQSVEATLSALFRLANLWDCILLFDEAEIFLSRRERRDDNLQRNALVSIFLRTLEYYSGILFLTTNRVGALDEAVKSRVHMSLFYPYLGENETLSLFRMNISRLQRIEQERKEIMAIDGAKVMIIEEEDILKFAKEHFKRHKENPDTRWNGRQIRNAFQTAASLARYAHHCKPHRGLYLGSNHFEEVEEATVEFEEYRQEMYGKLETEIVAERGERVNDRLRQNG